VTDASVAEAIAQAAILARQGRAKDGLALLEDATAAGTPLESSVLLLKAELLEALLEGAEAARLLGELLQRFPSDPAVLLRAGLLAYRAGDLAKAEVLLRRCWHVARLPEAGYHLGRMELASGRSERALQTLAAVIATEAPRGHWRQHAEELASTANTDGELS
jgi:hypothetical protein